VPARSPLDLFGILPQYKLFAPATPERSMVPDDQDSGLCFQVPVRRGMGPDLWSTSTALVPVQRICHDVNGYYRELGVNWRATRRELAVAYMARNGMASSRLTYIFKQLLNPKVREAYDRTGPGGEFLDDYTQTDLKRRASDEAVRRSTLGQTASADDIMDEWGYVTVPEDGIDSVSPMGKDRGQRRNGPWNYSYYAWKTSGYLQNEERLQQWQELLSMAAARQRVAPVLAIGLTAMSDRPFMLEDINGKPVVFFPEESQPDLSVAEDAIEHSLQFSPNPLESSESEIS
jgi:hypothetical protein